MIELDNVTIKNHSSNFGTEFPEKDGYKQSGPSSNVCIIVS
jgi:hypothetical protein